ncbi:MAG: hypothetical protein OHK0029_22750 [Armatimonadaceae bacterium]
MTGTIGVTPVRAQEPTQRPDTAPTTPPVGEMIQIELPTPLTLAQAIDLALILQPNLVSATANRQRSEAQQTGVQAQYLPRLTPTYSYLNQFTFGTVNQFIPGSGVVVPVQQGTTREIKQAQIGLSYRLIDNGVRELNARQARQSLRAARFSEENTRQTVIANVADTYFAVLRTEALVVVSRAQVERAKNTRDVVQAQVEVGVTAQKDIFQAEADYLNAQVNLLQAEVNADVAQANLKNAIGLVGGEPLQLADVPAPTPETPVSVQVEGLKPTAFTPPVRQDVETLALLTDAAYQIRPDIAQQNQNVEAQKTQVKISQANAGFQFTTDIQAAEQLDPNHFDRSIGRNRQFNLNLSYPLFDGGLVRSQVRANRANVQQGEAQLASLKQQIAVEVEQAYRNLLQARAALPAAQAAQRAAQINFDAALESQKEGVGSIVEVITAQTSLVQAQTNYVQAVFNFYAADARLARAVGQADRIAGIGQSANDPTANDPTTNPTGTAPAVPAAPTGPSGPTGTTLP